jgi:alpha-tubulin suppressor-like RCC1 family protein
MRRCTLLAPAAAFAIASAGALAAQTPPTPGGSGDTLRFVSISAGTAHACGITAHGKAYCWGRNDAGQIGDSTTTDRPTPVAVRGNIVFRQISAGDRHTCGVSTYDEPYCWGANEHGQLGNGAKGGTVSFPFRVAGDLTMTLIVAGKHHTCATRKHHDKQDRVMCWGSNAGGQLGDMDADDSSLPIEAFGVIRFVSLALGDAHTCGATREGRVFCWGANNRGQIGNASTTESRVPFFVRPNRRATFVKVAAGSAHSCGLTAEGEVFCWGDNAAGQVGTGKGSRVLSPALVRDPLAFRDLTAGGLATCGLRPDGTASCWGSNTAGQLGSAAGAGSPVPMPALPGITWSAISLGPAAACGLRTDGVEQCWGRLSPATPQ